jgi:NAD(P)-dependent dehydrogenase (short-subunit alcohol dehydrogenase family)
MTEAEGRRVAIVTGSARPWGIGRAAARCLAQRGYDIVIADIRDDWGAEGADSIRSEFGVNALYHRTDVSNRDDVTAMVAASVAEFGRIDVLVNDAGIKGPRGRSTTETFDLEGFQQVIGVNLLGPMLCTQAVVPAMKALGRGRVVNVASTAPYKPPPDSTVALYCAAKGGLIGWSKAAAVELAQYGIVVNVVAVGGLSTAMGSDEPPDEAEVAKRLEHYGSDLPWGRTMTADEAGELLALVADAPNHGFLGATIHASGGRVMPL